MDKQNLVDSINWVGVMSAPREPGGHIGIFRAIFSTTAKIIGAWIEDDYQGEEAFAFEFEDGTIAIITDYFGSCSVCDVWEDATDEDVRALVRQLAINSRIFPNREAAREFCTNGTGTAESFSMRAAKKLIF